MAAGNSAASVLVPHWLDAAARAALAGAVRMALAGADLHPVTSVQLADVLTELHVAEAREAVWPGPTARVRRVTGWDDDVLPVRLSATELRCVLALGTLPASVRLVLDRAPR